MKFINFEYLICYDLLYYLFFIEVLKSYERIKILIINLFVKFLIIIFFILILIKIIVIVNKKA
jgi:hypothetical protein